MASRFNYRPPADRQERIERAHDTLGFCEAMYQIHAQEGDTWGAEMHALKAMQRAALAVFQENCDHWDSP